eukprot:scaffold139141_cov37-Prasinocladus_malaysianus.AAC.1
MGGTCHGGLLCASCFSSTSYLLARPALFRAGRVNHVKASLRDSANLHAHSMRSIESPIIEQYCEWSKLALTLRTAIHNLLCRLSVEHSK